jgi:hypothetical protein
MKKILLAASILLCVSAQRKLFGTLMNYLRTYLWIATLYTTEQRVSYGI